MGTSPELRDGSEWMEHEDFLVANEAGLKRLREACDVALRDGCYSGGDLGRQWIGVKRLEPEWFDDPKEAPTSALADSIGPLILVSVFAIFAVGVVTIVRWIFW
jgi:hypothetical protein